jgi:hypothetical protein
VWTGHKIYTTVFGGVAAVLVGYVLHRVWSRWRSIVLGLEAGVLGFILLAGAGFLVFLVFAPAQFDAQARERIQLLEQANSDLSPSPYADVVRNKIIKSLDSCTLDGLELIEYIDASTVVLEDELVEKFGIEALDDAKKSMLLKVQPTQVRSGNNEPIQTNLYSFRDPYAADLKDILLSRRQQI